MMRLLYSDVELIRRPGASGMTVITQERTNSTRYAEEIDRLTRAFTAGCGTKGFTAVIIEPFMPKQETARGLALAPEAFLSQRAAQPDDGTHEWPEQSAYQLDNGGVVKQTMTEEYRTLAAESFEALRQVFADDDAFRAFLESLFDQPDGVDRFNIQAYYDAVWTQCLRHNPEPMLPGQPLPQKNTISGRFVEMLSAMNRMMKTV